MQIIFDANKNLDSILGKQKFDSQKKYRYMNFVICEDAPDGSLILYNNMTKSACVLDKSEKEAYESKDFSHKTNKWLLENWYFVPQGFSETKTFVQIRDLYSFIKKDRDKITCPTNFTILPTTNCNARCFYCYENGCKKYSMDTHRANDVADYILKNLEKSNSQKTTLSWFGGEPLVGKDCIDLIAKKLRGKGIEYESRMISNAYLFDKKLVEKAADLWKLKSIQVTLDGTEPVYNEIKAYVGIDVNKDASPFKKVLENIEFLLKAKINVVVRMNLTPDNFDDIKNLIDFLELRFKKYTMLSQRKKIDKKTKKLNYGVFSLYVHTIFQELEVENENDDAANKKLAQCYAHETELEKLIFDKGLTGQANLPRSVNINHCMADNPGSAVILPDGTLGSCEHYVDGEMCWGNIYDDKFDDEMLAEWKKKYPASDICLDCPYFPNCMRLKNCPNVSIKCLPAEKQWRDTMLHMQLKQTYNQWLNHINQK